MADFQVVEAGASSAVLQWSPWRFDLGESFLCSKCTFQNKKNALQCEMCNAPREQELGASDSVQYQVKYYRPGRTMETWKFSKPTLDCAVSLERLEPNSAYEARLRYRLLQPKVRKSKKVGRFFSKKDSDSPWIDIPDYTASFETLSSDHWLRLKNLSRVDAFLKKVLEPYPEDAAKRDTYVDKATRVGGHVLTAAGMVGVGGKYAKLARTAYRLHKTGFASVVFREDIQKMVIALTSYVGQVSKEFGLSSMDITLGSYYMIWENKRTKLLQPDSDRALHASGTRGVLQESADLAWLDRFGPYVGFSDIAYRPTPAQMQWVLRSFPRDQDRKGKTGQGFQLVASRCKSTKFRPAFALMASHDERTAVLAIRGTKQADDLVTDFMCDYEESAFHFHGDHVSTYKVHAGMLRAAKWMLRGDASSVADPDSEEAWQRVAEGKTPAQLRSSVRVAQKHGRDPDQLPSSGAGLGSALLGLFNAGFRIKLCGHSLGAGVATLMGLLLADMDPDFSVEVFGFGSPCCVDERLAEACKDRTTAFHAPGVQRIPGLEERVSVYNVVYEDDLVSRLSLFNARLFAEEIKKSKPVWEPLLHQDYKSYKSKAKTLWAPSQRGHHTSTKRVLDGMMESVSRVASGIMAGDDEAGKRDEALYFGEDDEEEEEEESNKNQGQHKHQSASRLSGSGPPARMLVAGLTLHIYTWRGAQLASLIDYRFEGLRRIHASMTMISDHKLKSLFMAFQSVRALSSMKNIEKVLPKWQSIEDHHAQGLYVDCAVCRYFVGWMHTGDSEAVEIRGTHHCRACGKIVCDQCSQHRVSFPELGMMAPVRTCDMCFARIPLNMHCKVR